MPVYVTDYCTNFDKRNITGKQEKGLRKIPVTKEATRELKRDFLHGHGVIGQGGMVLN